MAWFTKTKVSTEASEKRTLGKGLFRRCDGCAQTFKAEEFRATFEVCPGCGRHYTLQVERWIELLLDEDSFVEEDAHLEAVDALGFVDSKPYAKRLVETRAKAGTKDAILTGGGKLDGRDVRFGSFVFRFMGGSMGSVVGERIARLFERGAELGQPVILLSASGGARMQEGALSLMQMAKTVAALGRLREAGQPFISVLLDPTTGGVAASYALLGDVNVAEPGALIGFAGPRVIEQTIRQTLPEGFQRAEFLVEHGMVDLIAARAEMKAKLSQILGHLGG
ncbi:MAG: acetyl-CoA carboxylase carboxyltransferase subunit beta [Sandaracinus sp.]|nr:acetyl-CoA carboxylase carboxyltransferase subunit beta [Sandaracinus sp.]MCB9623454.1 acetyl-CoA carboxylase carboxyltransferase subunit beta [Sandaracinus sp.]